MEGLLHEIFFSYALYRFVLLWLEVPLLEVVAGAPSFYSMASLGELQGSVKRVPVDIDVLTARRLPNAYTVDI